VDEHKSLRALSNVRASTLAQMSAMTAELDALKAATADSNLDDEHDPEGSTVAFERAQLSTMVVQARKRLDEIEAALGRLSTSTYGLCERCGCAIADERLAVLPMTRHCLACASLRDSGPAAIPPR